MKNNRNNSDGIYITAALIIILVTILLLAAGCKFLELAADAGYERADFERVVHIVKPGEESWSIADKYCPAELDKRKYLEWCAAENGLDDMGLIYSGESYVFLKLRGEAK